MTLFLLAITLNLTLTLTPNRVPLTSRMVVRMVEQKYNPNPKPKPNHNRVLLISRTHGG